MSVFKQLFFSIIFIGWQNYAEYILATINLTAKQLTQRHKLYCIKTTKNDLSL